jgi:hypothetical protein
MRSVTPAGAPPGRGTSHADVRPVDVRPVDVCPVDVRPVDDCRWCGGPSAWVWSVVGDPGDVAPRRPDEDWPVCALCQGLTLAGDDAGVLDRYMTALTSRVAYPVAVDFLHDQGAATLAGWITRRASYRTLDRGAVR